MSKAMKKIFLSCIALFIFFLNNKNYSSETEYHLTSQIFIPTYLLSIFGDKKHIKNNLFGSFVSTVLFTGFFAKYKKLREASRFFFPATSMLVALYQRWQWMKGGEKIMKSSYNKKKDECKEILLKLKEIMYAKVDNYRAIGQEKFSKDCREAFKQGSLIAKYIFNREDQLFEKSPLFKNFFKSSDELIAILKKKRVGALADLKTKCDKISDNNALVEIYICFSIASVLLSMQNEKDEDFENLAFFGRIDLYKYLENFFYILSDDNAIDKNYLESKDLIKKIKLQCTKSIFDGSLFNQNQENLKNKSEIIKFLDTLKINDLIDGEGSPIIVRESISSETKNKDKELIKELINALTDLFILWVRKEYQSYEGAYKKGSLGWFKGASKKLFFPKIEEGENYLNPWLTGGGILSGLTFIAYNKKFGKVYEIVKKNL